MLIANQLTKNDPFTYRNRPFQIFTSPEILDKVCQFQFQSTDIIVATNQRSGTTFVQEILWEIKNIKADLKNESVDVNMIRFPFIEFNENLFENLAQSPIELLESRKSDPYRFIKTHVPYEFIKDNFDKVKPKMIVVMRNIKDCFVSNFFFESNSPFYPYKGTIHEYFNLFIKGKTVYGNYFDNNVEWWSLRNHDNVLTLFYEDLLMNLHDNVEKIADFVGDKLTNDEVAQIVQRCSFSTMYNNPKVNYKFNDNFTFLRKGIVGDWKNHLTEEESKIFDELIANKFEKVGLKFVYE